MSRIVVRKKKKINPTNSKMVCSIDVISWFYTSFRWFVDDSILLNTIHTEIMEVIEVIVLKLKLASIATGLRS